MESSPYKMHAGLVVVLVLCTRPASTQRSSVPSCCSARAMATATDEDEKLRLSCNCKTTACVKRYCQCFVAGFFCSHACNCKGCWNREHRRTFVEEHAELRLKTKPSAFQPKDVALTGEPRMHVKGCTCNKSGCKKNYCECFKKQVACTTRCKCQGCENSHGTGGKGLQENGDSGASGKPNEASDGADGSPGVSNESAVVIDEELLCPTGAGVAENVAAIAENQDSGTHIHQVGWHSLPPQCSSPKINQKGSNAD